MSRPLQRRFQCQALADLTRQLLFVPAPRRIKQARQAEKLHDELNPAVNYPLDFLIFRITGYRSDQPEPPLLVGEAILPDLRLLIDSLSRTAPVPGDEGETVETAGQLAQRLKVSTKTVARWRDRGLRWRWATTADPKRKQLVFPRAAVEHFLAQHGPEVERASQFTHLDDELKGRIIARARRLTQARELSLQQVAAHLAKRVGRGVQTVRQLLHQHDQAHPDQRIFADRSGPLDGRQKRMICRAYRSGVPVARLARQYQRTRSSIYRAIRQRRAAAINRLSLRFVVSPTFSRPDAEDVILRPDPQLERAAPAAEEDATGGPIEELPTALQPLYRQVILSTAQVQSLLARFNYFKFRADQRRGKLDRYEPRAADLADIEADLQQARAVRQMLVAGNLSVVLSVALQHLVDQEDRSPARLLPLLEVGNHVLVDCIDGYDITRPQTFAAFLTWSLRRRLAAQPELPVAASGEEPAATTARAATSAVPSPPAAGAHPATSHPAKPRALRRHQPDELLRRLVRKVGDSGVRLPLPPAPPTGTDAAKLPERPR